MHQLEKYKESIGHGHLWNYTLTIFWVKQLYSRMHIDYVPYSYTLADMVVKFKDFYDRNPQLHNGRLHEKYYSRALIFSDRAKKHYIEPDFKIGRYYFICH